MERKKERKEERNESEWADMFSFGKARKQITVAAIVTYWKKKKKKKKRAINLKGAFSIMKIPLLQYEIGIDFFL